MRHLRGAADVSSPTGGGEIDVNGTGTALNVPVRGANNYYTSGNFTFTDYDIDLTSEKRGRLKAGAGGYGYSLGMEAGRRIALDKSRNLIPRTWLVHTRVSVDKFTDSVNSRVFYPTADRFVGGFGVGGRMGTRLGKKGACHCGGRWTPSGPSSEPGHPVLVSGERLISEAAKNSFLLGLSGTYRQGPFALGVETSAAAAVGSNVMEYSGFFHFGVRF